MWGKQESSLLCHRDRVFLCFSLSLQFVGDILDLLYHISGNLYHHLGRVNVHWTRHARLGFTTQAKMTMSTVQYSLSIDGRKTYTLGQFVFLCKISKTFSHFQICLRILGYKLFISDRNFVIHVLPTFRARSTEAPLTISSRQISTCPSCAAMNSGVTPSYMHTTIGLQRSLGIPGRFLVLVRQRFPFTRSSIH